MGSVRRNLSGAFGAAVSSPRSSDPEPMDLLAQLEAAASSPRDSADIEAEMRQQMQASANFLREEHENGVRVCYTGQYKAPRDGRVKEKSDGTYTIKEFLKLCTDMFESDEPEHERLVQQGVIPAPQYGDKFKTQQDLLVLVDKLGASFCTVQPGTR